MTLFNNEQEALDWARSKLVQIGDKYAFDVSFYGKKKKEKVSNDELDKVKDRIKIAIKEAIGSSIVNNGSRRYTVTSFGADGDKILLEFIQTYPDEIDALVEAIKAYYSNDNSPVTINNFFIRGMHKDYKDFLEQSSTNTFLLR